MTTITILPETSGSSPPTFRAMAGKLQSLGQTAGQALDGLTALLTPEEKSTLVVVQSMQPDAFFSKLQQERLGELMTRWRAGREGKPGLSPAEQEELEQLVAAETQAAGDRAAQLLHDLTP